MKKIIIFGNSGSGKSTLAKKMSKMFDLQHLDLDTLAWEDTQPPTRKNMNESISLLEKFLSEYSEWVVEGCYADLLTYMSKRSNEIIFLNPGTDICVRRCQLREWEPHKYKSKLAQDKNLEMLITWVKEYENRTDEFSLKSHLKLYESFMGLKSEIRDVEYIF